MVGAGVVGAGVTMTVCVGAGAGIGCVVVHAARLRPAASASTGIAITLLSFIVLPPPVQKSLISLSVSLTLRSVHHAGQSRMTGRSGPNDRTKMTGKAEPNVTQRDSRRTFGNQSPPGHRVTWGNLWLPPAPGVAVSGHRGSRWAGNRPLGGLAGGCGGWAGAFPAVRRRWRVCWRPGRISVISQPATAWSRRPGAGGSVVIQGWREQTR